MVELFLLVGPLSSAEVCATIAVLVEGRFTAGRVRPLFSTVGVCRECGRDVSGMRGFNFPFVTEVDDDRLEPDTKSTYLTSTGVDPPGESRFITLISGPELARLPGLVVSPAFVCFLAID